MTDEERAALSALWTASITFAVKNLTMFLLGLIVGLQW